MNPLLYSINNPFLFSLTLSFIPSYSHPLSLSLSRFLLFSIFLPVFSLSLNLLLPPSFTTSIYLSPTLYYPISSSLSFPFSLLLSLTLSHSFFFSISLSSTFSHTLFSLSLLKLVLYPTVNNKILCWDKLLAHYLYYLLPT